MKFLLIILFSMQIFSQSFEERAVEYLHTTFPEYQKIEIQLNQNFSSDDKIEIDYTRNVNINRGIALIPVIATKGKKTSASVISVKVKLLKKIFVANRDFDRKEELNKSGFEEKVLDITKFNGNSVNVDFQMTDYRAKTFIKKGEILLEEKIEKIPLISSGDKVTAEVRSGNVIVTTEAFARQQGGIGDKIEFVSPDNKIFKAIIVDTTKVLVK